MKIDRSELQTALKTAKPALALKSPITQFMYYWFDGETLTAYNDILGISVPCKTDFTCGLSGALLSGFVDNSRAKHADLALDGNEVVLKLAGAKAKLTALAGDQQVWQLPEPDKKWPRVIIDAALVDGLKHLQLSSSEYGVCFSSEDGSLSLYSTTRRTTSWFYSDQKFKHATVLVPAEFCDQIVARASTGVLYFATDSVLAVFDDGVGIFSRLLDGKPLPFKDTLDRLLKDAPKEIPIPSLLALSLNRVGVLETDATKIVRSTYKAADGKLYVTANVPNVADLAEVVPLEGKHPQCEAVHDSALIRKALGASESFCFTPECFVMTGRDGATGYVVAALV